MAKRRPSSRYLKLYDYEPCAITWFDGNDKIIYLCESIEEANEKLAQFSMMDKAKVEDRYISRPTFGIIRHSDNREPVIDAWTGKPNVCKALNDLDQVKVSTAKLNGCVEALKAARRRAAIELEELEGALVDASLGVNGARTMLARIDRLRDAFDMRIRDLDAARKEIDKQQGN